MNFKKWVKNIQTAGYNGAPTVYRMTLVKYPERTLLLFFKSKRLHFISEIDFGQISRTYFWETYFVPILGQSKMLHFICENDFGFNNIFQCSQVLS